jgi:putative lipoic acid-binding regulatory protein
MDKKTEAFFERLKTELENSNEWPAEYLFKFIVPTDQSKIAAVENTFNGLGAVIQTKKSKNETYTSVSVNVQMQSAQQIIDKYLAVSDIEGIISL